MAAKKEPSQGMSIIDKSAILVESIKKEMKHHRLTTEFTINPFRPSEYILMQACMHITVLFDFCGKNDPIWIYLNNLDIVLKRFSRVTTPCV